MKEQTVRRKDIGIFGMMEIAMGGTRLFAIRGSVFVIETSVGLLHCSRILSVNNIKFLDLNDIVHSKSKFVNPVFFTQNKKVGENIFPP